METSVGTNIATKILSLMQACEYIQKEAENKEQKYKYVPDAAIMRKINPELVKNKIIAIPEFSVISEKDKPTKSGSVWQFVSVQCVLTLIDAESGEKLTVTSLGSGVDSGDKAVAKAQTMAMKYAWMKLLQVETGDDPEADEQTDKQVFGASQQDIGEYRVKTKDGMKKLKELSESNIRWLIENYNGPDAKLKDYAAKYLMSLEGAAS